MAWTQKSASRRTFATSPSALMQLSWNIPTATDNSAQWPADLSGKASPMERFNEFLRRDEDGFQRQGSLDRLFVIKPRRNHHQTNNHVIENADEIGSFLRWPALLDATLIGRDRDNRPLPVLKVNSRTPLALCRPGRQRHAEVGRLVHRIATRSALADRSSAGNQSGRPANRDT